MQNQVKKIRRKKRIRAKVRGTSTRPRLSVFRSNAAVYTQLIDDEHNKTLVGVSQKHLGKEKKAPLEAAKAVGLLLAQKAKDLKIKQVVFDRGSYAYHGRVKAVAQGAREGGLEF